MNGIDRYTFPWTKHDGGRLIGVEHYGVFTTPLLCISSCMLEQIFWIT